MSESARKPFLSEEEQRSRIRQAAIELEFKLEVRADHGENVAAQLAEVRSLLDSIGRKASYTEELLMERRRTEEKRA